MTETPEILRSLKLILQPGQVTELRVLDAVTPGRRWPHIESGYFDDPGKLIRALESIRVSKGNYFIPNLMNPALLSRAVNRIRPIGKEPLTSDHDIVRRLWLLVDADPVRPADIPSSNAEHAAAVERVTAIATALCADGWPNPIVADSGNGAHLMYRIDLLVHDGGLVERCLNALSLRFGDEVVKIDESVHNPARIWKLPGTLACKGDSTPERPHRMSRLINAPDRLEVVPIEKLEALAAFVPQTVPMRSQAAHNGQFNLAEWIRERNLPVNGPFPWKDGKKWVFDVCPWNSEHTNKSAVIVQFPNGAIAARCLHDSCSRLGWHELRDKVEPGRQQHPSVSSVSAQVSRCSENWPTPKPLPSGLSGVAPFDPRIMPEAFRPWIEDIADRIQCPIDFPAVSAMIALAGLVGRKVGIRPKRHDDWLVVPNLWGAVIGRPGVMKTPAIQEPFKPIKYLEIQSEKRFRQTLEDSEVDGILAKAASKEFQDKMRDALEIGNEQEARQWAERIVKKNGTTSKRRRYIVNDSTVEKLGIILNENPNGITVYRDELIGLLRSLEKDGQEGARAFYLEAWNGTGRYTYDRIGRGTLDIDAAIVSVVGAIQPGPLSEYLKNAARFGLGDDGLMQRFQLAVWPDVTREWRNVDRWPDSAAKHTAYDVFFRLDAINPLAIGATPDSDEPDGIPFLRFTKDAQEAFDSWREKLETRIRGGEEHAAIESHLAKYRSLIPSLALLIHLADDMTGPVALDCTVRAIEWGKYLESHARRIFSLAINPDIASAKAMAVKLKSGELIDGFTVRDVYRHCWTGLSTKDEVLSAIANLMNLDWLHEENEKTGGAPRTVYRINPKIYQMAPAATDKTDKSTC